MNKLKYKGLTLDSFSKYGSFANMINPKTCKVGIEPDEFYRDMIKQDLGQANQICFSTSRVMKRPLIIDNLEYHTYTGEGMMPLDGDILLCFAPASANDDLPIDQIECFYASKGTMLVIHPGVWHCAAFPYDRKCVNVLIALPERVYANDCKVVNLANEQWLEIENHI